MRTRRLLAAVALAASAATVLAACGSGSSGGDSTAGSTTGTTAATGSYKLGVLVDETGPEVNLKSGIDGVKAYVNYVNSQGGVNGAKLTYVTADSQSTPAGALTGAQKLVQQDHVFAIISLASALYAAQPFLLKSGVPVLGTGFDGPEWADASNTNMFTVAPDDYSKVYALPGLIMKALGVTSCAAVGYSDIPSSNDAAKANNISCTHAGLKAPYVAEIKAATTDYGPVALQIKASGADGLATETAPQTGFGLGALLKEQGANMKAIVLANGYGGDLLASPAGVKAAQGFSFQVSITPMEIKTPATTLFAKNLQAVGITGDPDYGVQSGYQAVAAFAAGVKAVGANASEADFIKGMRAVTGFTADGLLAGPVDFNTLSPKEICAYVVTLKNAAFVPVSQEPFCGGVIGSV